MKKKITVYTILYMLLFAALAQPVRAECVPADFVGLLGPGQERCPGTGSGSGPIPVYNPIKVESVPELVNSMVKTILGIVGAVALLMFVYGGLLWMTSGGNERRIERGRDTLIWAAVGLAVIFGSYAILNVLFKAFEGS